MSTMKSDARKANIGRHTTVCMHVHVGFNIMAQCCWLRVSSGVMHVLHGIILWHGERRMIADEGITSAWILELQNI